MKTPPRLTLHRTPHDWPSYLCAGQVCLAWLWGKAAVLAVTPLTRAKSAPRKRKTQSYDKH